MEITQADRALLIHLLELDDEQAERVNAGTAYTQEVADIAAHRLTERASIVAWLRVENGLCDCFARDEFECGCGAWDDWKTKPLLQLADAIEAGEHVNP